MAYEAHKWKIGEEITSDKLNHIEKGIEEAGLPREITDPQDGQTLKYDAEKEKFVNADAAIETNITNPTDGQTLKYDAESGKWVNGEGGSGKLVVNATTDAGTNVKTLDKTWQEIFDASPNVVLQEQAPIGNATLWTMLSAMSTAPEVDKGYQVTFDETQYYAATANDYPDSDDGSLG